MPDLRFVFNFQSTHAPTVHVHSLIIRSCSAPVIMGPGPVQLALTGCHHERAPSMLAVARAHELMDTPQMSAHNNNCTGNNARCVGDCNGKASNVYFTVHFTCLCQRPARQRSEDPVLMHASYYSYKSYRSILTTAVIKSYRCTATRICLAPSIRSVASQSIGSSHCNSTCTCCMLLDVDAQR